MPIYTSKTCIITLLPQLIKNGQNKKVMNDKNLDVNVGNKNELILNDLISIYIFIHSTFI